MLGISQKFAELYASAADLYQKLATHVHGYAGADQPGGPASDSKRLNGRTYPELVKTVAAEVASGGGGSGLPSGSDASKVVFFDELGATEVPEPPDIFSNLYTEPIGFIGFALSRIPEGCLTLDTGAELSRATYPELWSFVSSKANLLPVLTDADWLATAKRQTSVVAFSSGDGVATFRLPKLVDYPRGGSLADVGKWYSDAIRNISGFTGYSVGNSQADLTGPFTSTTGSGLGYVSTQPNRLMFDASAQVPTADENRPKTLQGVFYVRAYHGYQAQGKVDLTQLANDVARLNSTSISIGMILPHLAKAAPKGWLAVDAGDLVLRADHPDLWTWVQTNAPLVSEAEWQTMAGRQTSVGAYSTGDGVSTFRLPRILDYVRGGSLADVGVYQGDAIRNITGSLGYMFTSANDQNGVFTSSYWSDHHDYDAYGYKGGISKVNLDASRQVPTANENRPKTLRMLYCVKADIVPGDNVANAATASKLENPVTINLTGDVMGSVQLDGSGDVTLKATSTTPPSTSGFKRFTTSGAFTVPLGVTEVILTGCGGGAGGYGNYAMFSGTISGSTHGSGGSAGSYVFSCVVSVEPGKTYVVTVGQGGTGGSQGTSSANGGGPGGPGGVTSFDSLLIIPGGQSGVTANNDQVILGEPGGSSGSSTLGAAGASGPFGTGGARIAGGGTSRGNNARGFGAGGGGGLRIAPGGSGTPGFLLIQW